MATLRAKNLAKTIMDDVGNLYYILYRVNKFWNVMIKLDLISAEDYKDAADSLKNLNNDMQEYARIVRKSRKKPRKKRRQSV